MRGAECRPSRGYLARTAAGNANAARQGAGAFAGSERDLVRHAPVIEDFKRLDGEIVGSSIRFRWRDVREQFGKRVDGAAVCRAWLESTG
jgi:hypothetical protein